MDLLLVIRSYLQGADTYNLKQHQYEEQVLTWPKTVLFYAYCDKEVSSRPTKT